MQKTNKLSLSSAILINVNIMLGVGIFINTVVLSQISGILGFLSYTIVGILMLPLILGMAKLVSVAPEGGFFEYGKKFIHPFAGFLGTWSYFWGKLASCTLMIHTFATIVRMFIPATKIVPILAIDCTVIALFVSLNMLNIKTGTKIQALLFGLKVIPILFVILCGIGLTNINNITFDNAIWSGFPVTLALVLYAFTGFEASCSLSQSIENAKKNASKAILISYGIAVLTCIIYQFFAFGVLGTTLNTLPHFSSMYGILASKIFTASTTPYITIFIYATLATSALGGAYGIMFSNNWNLYQLAKNKLIFFPKALSAFNKHNIPYLCVIIEGLICIMYLAISSGNQLPLQQSGAFGCILAYTISIIALAKGVINKKIKFNKIICSLAVINCIILIAATIQSFIATTNVFSLVLFSSILTLGVITFMVSK